MTTSIPTAEEIAALVPRWTRDLERLLPIRSQFIISGNIRDHFLTPVAEHLITPAPLRRCLWQVLARQHFEILLIYDPVEGIRPYPGNAATQEIARTLFKLNLQDGQTMPMSLDHLADLMGLLNRTREVRAALLIDFASRLARHPDQLDAGEHRFFLAAERLAVHAVPIVLKTPPPGHDNRPRFNPILWLLNRPQDLPSWFALDNARIESIGIGLPDFDVREAAARSYFSLFAPDNENTATIDETSQAAFAAAFARATEGLTLVALSDIAQLANRQGIGWERVEDAVQCYKVGVLENPWKKSYLKSRIAHAAAQIETRVKGQPQAVTKTVDILMRSVMGLTGAQAKSGGNRPRGVLFFAGPSGVGKTELAKTLTELIFGDERAYIRFDMSEFAEEHNSARLLGAPPGYVGFEAGGELTNAVREKPFSVVLFDEVEKAHPRILDKFLQILEDGRLTDGRGDVTYFSETLLVFTSNLGIFIEDEHGRRVQNIVPGDPYEVVETRIKDAIADYFKYHLSRPEILNRIGDNIVVFNFITASVAKPIFVGMLENVLRRVREEHRLALHFAPAALQRLQDWCIEDLGNGGRGIGNRLESRFINPLARALFALDDLARREEATITDLVEDEMGIVSVILR
ncbi:MAG: AAA family ATPase [Azoarcus sp.]|nr:AAA family ATPase [Azoarcus sp.]